MSEHYKLVFSGEVLEGQHPAVVQKRLAALLKLDDERMTVLFSGKAVVVKKIADNKTAARYQQAFKKAGARLRVLPATGADTSSNPAPSDGLAVLPQGSDILTDQERTTVPPVEVPTDHLALQGAVFVVDTDEPAADVPNVDHLTLAELGSLLGNAHEPVVEVEIDAHFDLAEVGALLQEVDAAETSVNELPDPHFELAEPGEVLDTRPKPPPPAAPDTSHLSLDQSSDDTPEEET